MIYDVIGVILARVVRKDFVKACQKSIDIQSRKKLNRGFTIQNPVQRHVGKYY